MTLLFAFVSHIRRGNKQREPRALEPPLDDSVSLH